MNTNDLKISAAAKAYVALIGLVATALLQQYGPDGNLGGILTVVVIVAGAVGTWYAPYGGSAKGGNDE